MIRRDGSITARGRDTYLVRVYLGESDGKRRYAAHTVYGSRAAAQQFLEDRLRERRTGDFVEPATLTLGDWLDRWLKDVMARQVTPKTLRGYQDVLRLYVRPRLGTRRLADLTTADVQALYTAMTDGGLSPRTVRHVHAALRPALEKAVQWRLSARNPALNVDLPRGVRREMRAMTKEEARAFLLAAKEDPHYALFVVALTTGMRPGEYLALQWKDIDMKTGAVHVTRALERVGSAWRFKDPKTARYPAPTRRAASASGSPQGCAASAPAGGGSLAGS